jgi:hypothetical protein
MKLTIKVFLLLLISASAYAQTRIHLGMNTGFNSTHVLDKGLNQDPRYISTTNFKWAPVGISFGVDFGNFFGLQVESIKAAQGQIYQMIETAQNVERMIAERNIDLDYIQLPFLLKMMGGGNKAARFNFQLGPQLSILNSGAETIKFIENGSFDFAQDGDIPIDMTTVMVANEEDIPFAYQEALANGEVTPPSSNGMEVPLEYFQNPENPDQFDLPQDAMMTLMSSEAQNEIQRFKDKEVQLAFGFGMDFDVFKHFYISALVRGNYSFTDMRNSDLIEFIGDEDITSIFSQRANLAIGAQTGLHWVIGGNRSFRARKKAAESEDTFR